MSIDMKTLVLAARKRKQAKKAKAKMKKTMSKKKGMKKASAKKSVANLPKAKMFDAMKAMGFPAIASIMEEDEE